MRKNRVTIAHATDYPVITQDFGVNRANYAKWGLPGHEGMDERAPTGTGVYAVLPMIVTEVGWHKANHPYGYAVRGKLRMGPPGFEHEYQFIYAHGLDGTAKVKVGDRVPAGTLLMEADNTGNSSAAHLHLTLRRVGASKANATHFPTDIIDPTILIDLAFLDEEAWDPLAQPKAPPMVEAKPADRPQRRAYGRTTDRP